MSARLKIVLWVLLLAGGTGANAAPSTTPVIELGTPNNYCVVYCYIRVPFTITNYDVTHKMGRIFCEFDAEVTARLPVYNGEARTKSIQASPIGVFKNEAGKATGDVEMSTGIIKKYFEGAKVKNLHCHL
jgi:hypothetical protein